MSAPFVDPDDLKASLSLQGTTFADDDVEQACIAATEALQEELGRKFSKDSSDVTRYYTALDPSALHVRDLVSITTLRTDDNGDGSFETTWGTDDYLLQDLNAAADNLPYTRIESDRRTGDKRFPTTQRGVEIVGKWGWPKLPTRLVTAAGILAAQLIKRKRENPGFIITSEMAVVILRNDPQLNALLKGLSRPKVVEN